MKTSAVMIACFCFCAALLFGEEKPPQVAPNAAFEKMKTLAGSWKGFSFEGGEKKPCSERLQTISDGSVLMAWLNEHQPEEMVTMIHQDGADLLATHYCAAHNQPRLMLVRGGRPNELVFKFKDGTNIAPGGGHMNRVAFIFDRPNHHIEDWTYLENGKETTAHFEFERKG